MYLRMLLFTYVCNSIAMRHMSTIQMSTRKTQVYIKLDYSTVSHIYKYV